MTEEDRQLKLCAEIFKKVQALENEAELGLQGRLALCANLYGALIAAIEHDLGREKAIFYARSFADYCGVVIEDCQKQIEAREQGIPIAKAGEA